SPPRPAAPAAHRAVRFPTGRTAGDNGPARYPAGERLQPGLVQEVAHEVGFQVARRVVRRERITECHERFAPGGRTCYSWAPVANSTRSAARPALAPPRTS